MDATRPESASLYPLFGLLVVFSDFCSYRSHWAQARGVDAGDELSTLLGAHAMAGEFRPLTNYDRCDRYQHKAREKKVACNPVERRQYLICNSSKIAVLIVITYRPDS